MWVSRRVMPGELRMSATTVTADAKFLRRVFLGLVALTIFTGSMAALAAAQAMSTEAGNCLLICG
jgi:hypothetical protein